MDLTDNVLKVYSRASEDSISRGMTWYDEAHDFAVSLGGDKYQRAAGVIAALSPLSGWNNNKNKAAQLYAQNGEVVWNGTKNGLGLANNVRKAIRIYNGEDALDVLRKPKTRSFFSTIVDPRGDHDVVVDRHAFDIAVGMPTDNKSRSTLERKGEYARFSSAYVRAARIAGIAPAQLQAITWVQWRKEFEKDWLG